MRNSLFSPSYLILVVVSFLLSWTSFNDGCYVQSFQVPPSYFTSFKTSTTQTYLLPSTKHSNNPFIHSSKSIAPTNNNNIVLTKCYGNIQFTTNTTITNNQATAWLENNLDDVTEQQQQQLEENKKPPQDMETFLVVFGPAIMFALSFIFYENTAQTFHNFVEWGAQNNFQIVDGSKALTEELLPALNGPVATSVAILFGTLTSMTVSNLYNRQTRLATLYEDTLEEIRIAKVHFDCFPTSHKIEIANEKYATKNYNQLSKDKIDEYKNRLMSFLQGTTPKTMQGRRKLEGIMSLLHEMVQDSSVKVHGRILDEAYGSLNRIFKLRSEILSLSENQFPIWHYGNLGLLGSTILIIFLVETDKPALQYLGGFQLKLCWAILIGTYAMLASVIYDLATPFTGSYQIVIPIKEKAFKDEDDEDENNNTNGGTTASTE